MQDFSVTITTNKKPSEVFNAIINPKIWWSGQIDGESNELNAVFRYRYKDIHDSTQKVIEFIPDKKVVWHVTDSNISFVKNKSEWTNTDIVFEISEQDGTTLLTFTHRGLKPQIECYEACSSGWNSLITENLKNYIQTGTNTNDPFASIK